MTAIHNLLNQLVSLDNAKKWRFDNSSDKRITGLDSASLTKARCGDRSLVPPSVHTNTTHGFHAKGTTIPSRQSNIMNVLRNRFNVRAKSRKVKNGTSEQQTLTLKAGEVHEASHWMPYKGNIDISGFTFEAEPVTEEKQYSSVQSFLDIIVFAVPNHCSFETCNVSKYGVGKMDIYKNRSSVNLCENGRLGIDSEFFHGFHTQLMVPSIGPMPGHVKNNKIALPNKEQMYAIVFANCNDAGREVLIVGQPVFSYDENQIELTFASVVLLTIVALSICLLLTFLTVRIRPGTRAEYNEYQRLSTIDR
jgi:hypothetical protein